MKQKTHVTKNSWDINTKTLKITCVDQKEELERAFHKLK
jgi:hypothetical protein